jgi:hypothetical protein
VDVSPNECDDVRAGVETWTIVSSGSGVGFNWCRLMDDVKQLLWTSNSKNTDLFLEPT